MNVPRLKEQIEYKFAPEPLIAVQALANTYSFEDDEELLLDPESTRKWLLDSGLITPKTTVSPAEHLQLTELRETLRALLESNLSGDPDGKAGATLGRIAKRHPVDLKTDERGELELDLEPAGTVGEVIAQMIGITWDAQSHDRFSRLKICASDECRWAFFDSSKNRGGTWCKMETCGNRINNRRYRKRVA